MKKIVNILLLCLLVVSQQYGQQCGTLDIAPPHNYKNWTLPQIDYKSGTMTEILLKIHIIRRSDGTGGIDGKWVVEGVHRLNNIFEREASLRFKICPDIDYIDNTTLYSNNIDSTIEADSLYPRRVNYAIDVFYAPITNPTTDGFIASWAHFPWSAVAGDCIIMHYHMAAGNTLAHEVGHYLGLLHTHAHTHLLSDTIPNNHDPLLIEFANGLSCHRRGDGLCDTPADPGLGGQVTSDGQGNACTYMGTLSDPHGNFFVPDVHNVMSYTNDDCRKAFSPQQIGWIWHHLQHSKPNVYAFRNSACPCTQETVNWLLDEDDYTGCKEEWQSWTTIEDLSYISANQLISSTDIITSTADMHYEAVEKIRFNPGFKVVLGGKMQARAIQACNHTCSGSGLKPVIDDITVVSNVEKVGMQLICFPNPAHTTVQVEFTLSDIGGAQIQLFNLQGQLILTLEEKELASGRQYYQLSTTDIPSGLYLLTVKTKNGLESTKLRVQH